MKKCLFFIVALMLSFTALRAQNFYFVYEGDTLTYGDTVVYLYGDHRADLEDVEFMVEFGLLNGSDDTLTTQISIEQVSQNEAFAATSVCAGMCVEGTVSTPFDVPAHGIFSDIQAHFECRHPTGIVRGNNDVFRVQTGAPSDAKSGEGCFYLKIESSISGGGIADAYAAAALRAWPNPAKGQVSVAYELPAGTSDAELVVLNALGQQVLALPLNAAEGSAVISLQSLPQGLYLYGIRGDNNASPMRKLIVR
ncbi:MAG: T9SS type A sorting domain-containing protein [Bacteroidales bacterium]|nr:T9SS type A sorting domain-containing protein [Bacteroidales bacterium]